MGKSTFSMTNKNSFPKSGVIAVEEWTLKPLSPYGQLSAKMAESKPPDGELAINLPREQIGKYPLLSPLIARIESGEIKIRAITILYNNCRTLLRRFFTDDTVPQGMKEIPEEELISAICEVLQSVESRITKIFADEQQLVPMRQALEIIEREPDLLREICSAAGRDVKIELIADEVNTLARRASIPS